MADWKTKEYYSIFMDGIPLTALDHFLRGTLGLRGNAVKHSHFYTETDGDFSYTDSLDLAAYFTQRGGNSATVFAKTLCFDRPYPDVSFVICANDMYAEIDCDIEESDFDTAYLPSLQGWLTEMVQRNIITFSRISYSCDYAPLFEYGKGD